MERTLNEWKRLIENKTPVAFDEGKIGAPLALVSNYPRSDEFILIELVDSISNLNKGRWDLSSFWPGGANVANISLKTIVGINNAPHRTKRYRYILVSEFNFSKENNFSLLMLQLENELQNR